jgi:acyl-CoA thioester hydrolase
MYTSETTVRVRYADTDQMGYCYYGNYATFFEVGRVEALRQLGVSYRAMEESGVMLPVIDLQVKYLKPARYDEVLRIVTTIPEMPSGRIKFTYTVFNELGEETTRAETTLIFMRKEDHRPMRPPVALLEVLQPYFSA